MPNFVQHVESAVSALLSGKPDDVDYNDFVYSAQLVYDGTRDIRRAVLMNRVCMSTPLLSWPGLISLTLVSAISLLFPNKREHLNCKTKIRNNINLKVLGECYVLLQAVKHFGQSCYVKSAEMTLNDTHWHSLTLTDTQWHSLILDDAHWRSLILTDTHWHSLTLNDTHWHSLTLTDTHWIVYSWFVGA